MKNLKPRLRWLFVTIAVVLVLAIGCTAFLVLYVGDNTVVASVNGMDIYAGELRDQMTRDRAEILNQYEKLGVDVTAADFWTTEQKDGTLPMDTLRQTALENVKEYKLQQQLAMEYKLIEDPSYRAFRRSMEEENRSRAEKVENGEVIYGPQEYSVDSYYSYYLSSLVTDLRAAMSAEGQPLAATDEQLEQFYEEQKDSYYQKVDSSDLTAYTLDYEGGLEETSLSREEAEQKMEEVRKALLSGADAGDIKEEFPEVMQTDLVLNEETASNASKSNATMYEQAVLLRKGDVSPVFEDKLSFRVLQCTSYAPGEYETFSEAKESVRMHYTRVKYEELVAGLCEEYGVETNFKYAKVTITT